MNTTIPSAREVRDQQLVLEFGPYTVRYQNLDQRQNDRFKWLVYGPPGPDGCRDQIDDFATYREAIRDAQARSRGEFGEARGDDRRARTPLQQAANHKRVAKLYPRESVGRIFHQDEANRLGMAEQYNTEMSRVTAKGMRA